MAEHDINDQRLEEMLDAMLKAYSDEQPRPGLETRVQATLRAEAERRKDRARPWRWVWSTAATLALVAVILAIYIGRLQPLPEPPAIAAVKAPPPVTVPAIPGLPAGQSGSGRPRHPKPQLLPAASARQEVFPSPGPLSDQERLLIRYLAGTPHEEVASQSHGDDAAPEDGGQLPPQVREFKNTEVFSTR
jgi:hypothetical protein